MRPLFVRLLWVIAILAIGPATGTVRAEDFSVAELEEVVREELKQTHSPGAAVAIVRGDQVLLSKGFGVASVETGEAITPDSLFRLGSTTKMFTALAYLQLAEAGKIRLDEPIGASVPGLAPWLAQLTGHHLLTHTAGITDEAPMHGLHDDSALGKGIRAWGNDMVFTRPGQVHSYSNPGYWLAGLVVEHVGSKPYADVMTERVFSPLNMDRTTFRPTMAMTYPMALGHRINGGKLEVIRPIADNAASWPAGSMFSSIRDLTRFAIAFLNEGMVDGRQVLSSAVIRLMATPHVIAARTGLWHYGYGLMISKERGVTMVEHGGSRLGYGSLIRFLPEQQAAIIVLINRSAGTLPKTVQKATVMLAPAAQHASPRPVVKQTLTEEECSRLAGTYTNNRQTATLVVRDGVLFLIRGEDQSQVEKFGDRHYKTSDEEFLVVDGADGENSFLCLSGRALRKKPGEEK